MRRPYRQAHREPRTLGELLDEAASRPAEVARDFIALVILVAVGYVLIVLLAAMQP